MFLLAAAIASFSPVSETRAPAGASVQATATIRVIAGARLHFKGRENDLGIPRQHAAIVHTSDGRTEQARLFEFE